jgi:hypothetical protein
MTVDKNDILFFVDVVTKTPLNDDKEYIEKTTVYNSVLDKYITLNDKDHHIKLKKISDIWYIIQIWNSKSSSMEVNKIEHLDPISFNFLDKQNKVDILDLILKECVDMEAYEEASIIRDKITDIQNG